MTTSANIPAKWYVPFANGDSARVEIPVTTADPERASQTLGFPPLTMQPPEVGGVPPQGEDFNGAMNQIARVAWWVLNAGAWTYDASFATQANINGYPNGAKLRSADLRGDWLSTGDDNTVNPDTTLGNWVPAFQYGVTALTGLTGGTVTPTPAQAAKATITLAGTLTSALTVVLPTWLKDWVIVNNTTGAFVTIVKTAAGSGVTIPQNGHPTRVSGDGTNIAQAAANVASATTSTDAVQFGQISGVVGSSRNVRMSVTAASATATLTADEIIVESALGGLRYCLPSFSKVINLATTGAGGMDTGAAPATGYVALYAIYNPTTGVSALLATNAATLQGEVYGGVNMPAGFTASALVGVWPTNGSSQFVAGYQEGRKVSRVPTQVLATSTQQASPVALNISGAVPINARSVEGPGDLSSSTNAALVATFSGSASGVGQKNVGAAQVAQVNIWFGGIPLITPQTLYYSATASVGTMSLNVYVTGYTF